MQSAFFSGMIHQAGQHEEIVDACLARFARSASPEQLVQDFEQLVDALWLRSSRTLSEVTLDAIFERALHISRERFPILHSFKLDHGERRITGLPAHGGVAGKPQLTDAFRWFLITLLTLFGNLTADILLGGLYRELQTFSPQSSSFGLTAKRARGQAEIKEKKA